MAGLLSRRTDARRTLDAALRSGAPGRRETVSVLLVGGDAQSSGVLELLSKHDRIDFDVRSVPGADQALPALDDDRFDLVLLEDSPHPDRRFDLIRTIASSLDNPPVIALCGSADGAFAEQALGAGACQAVRKDSTAYLTLGRTVHHALLRYHREDEERRLRVELERLTVFDALTGIHNRRFLLEALDRECRRALRYGSSFSVLAVDVDDFAACNQACGRPAGDGLLKQIAELLARSVRDTDVASRCDADRFCLLVPETDFDGAMRLGERLRFDIAARRLAPANGAAKRPVGEPITVSVGVFTPRRQDDLQAEVIVARVDDALSRAKEGGKNKVWGRRPHAPRPVNEAQLTG